MSKQVLISKKKQKASQKTRVEQRLALHLLQKQLTLLKLEEYLIAITFIIGSILGRFFMQPFPSIEPITFFALLGGALFGSIRGTIIGASSWYLSNFLMFGGQGPWTVIHVISGAFSGFLGGFLYKKHGYIRTIFLVLVATAFFEITMNISSGLFLGMGILISFITAIPFTITHIASNVGFSLLIPKARKIIFEKGKLNEKELCIKLMNKIKLMKNKNNMEEIEYAE